MLGNYKIRVNNEAESKEAQELFFELGYSWSGSTEVKYTNSAYIFSYYENNLSCSNDTGYFNNNTNKEITLPQLRDLVVLHRNDVNDWNCVDPEFKEQKLYLCSDKSLYVFDDLTKTWKVSSKNGVNLVLNRLIMKEDQSLNNLISGSSEGLISRVDALRALEDGKDVEFKCGGISWRLLDAKQQPLEILIDQKVQFRLKPRNIKLEIEIPKPFKPKLGEFVFYLDGSCKEGFDFYEYDGIDLGNPLWRSSEEIKQVVEVLRNGIKGVDNV